MTFDDNSTRQHFKGVLVSLVTPNEADWYVNCLCHIYTHKKVAHRNLPTGNLHGFVVMSEDLLAARWKVPHPTIIGVNIAFLNVFLNVLPTAFHFH
jgi:hypothetical protein